MISADSIHIIDCLKINYGIDIVTLTNLHLGADMHAAVYKAHARDNTAYFVKVKERASSVDVGLQLQQLLHDAGIKEIIAPLKTKRGEIVQPMGDHSLIVFPFIEGHDGFTQQLTHGQWIQLGKALRAVHEFNIPATMQTQIPQETYATQHRDAVRSLIRDIDTKQAHDEIALQFVSMIKKHRSTIERLVECAEQLATKLKNASPEFVLCHGDIHAGNVLLPQDDGLYIIDWDNPIRAPKERDLMFIGGGVGNVWNNPDEEKLFYVGYGQAEVNAEIMTYYRCERIVQDIAEYSELLLLVDNQDQEDENRITGYNHFVVLFAPNGVVDIALRGM